MSSTLLGCLSISVLSALNLVAQSAGWSAVQSIPPGDDIRIAISGRSPIQGRLAAVTGESLVLNSSSGQQQTISRPEVRRLSVRKQSHRGRNALIGLAIGAGGGLGVGLAARCTGFCIVSTSEITAVTTVAGALVGTLVGVAIPTGGWRQIYKQ